MIKLQDGHKDIRITQSADWPVSHRIFGNLVSALDSLHTTVPMLSVRVKTLPTPGQFEYKLTTLDARTFTETMKDIVNITDYKSDFTVSSFWSIKELLPHRILRDIVVQLISEAGCTDIKVDWV